ncbi:MAG TPA: peptidylprolyl isomerase [Acidobacteriota bacterium]|nr:peptidylprolyl isomerase [Acidobacteriota bacterium]
MNKAKAGDTVKVHYTGKLEDGTVFDSSSGGDPLEFTIGQGRIIPGFENGIVGMVKDDKKTITTTSEEAYGSRREELMTTFDRSQLSDEIDPAVGMRLRMKKSDGGTIDVVVVDCNEKSVTIDANYPLAGKTLIFDVQLIEIA